MLATDDFVCIVVAVDDIVIVDIFFSVGVSDGLPAAVMAGFLVVDACKFVVVAEEATAVGTGTVVCLAPANDTVGGSLVVVFGGDVGVEVEEVQCEVSRVVEEALNATDSIWVPGVVKEDEDVCVAVNAKAGAVTAFTQPA